MASGMTSLASQLRKLQTPQTSLLDQSQAGTNRASLLFDVREASTLDSETVFAIGCSGLEELCKLNRAAFGKFEKTLFSEWGKNLQRAVQTKEQNEQLDATLTEFLYRLSPYLLLRPAHKALEWLLYRFRVHEYNTAVLMQAMLPFHETNIFARLLQLIDVSDETKCWNFLAATKTQGAVLTKKALIAQCAKTPGLFRFVCDIVPAMRKANSGSTSLRPAINLSTGVIVGVMELHGSRIDGKLVSAIVAHIADGFANAKQDGNSEWVSANCMVVAQLVKKQPSLKSDLLQLLLITMVKSLTEESVNPGLFTLLAAYRYQTNLDTLPQKIVKALLAFTNMPDRLHAAVDGSKYADKFLRLFMHGLFVHALMEPSTTNVVSLVTPYFAFTMDSTERRAMVTEQFLKAHLTVRVSSGEDKSCLVPAAKILAKLQQRAGDELDAEIVRGFQSNDRELIAELASECSLGVQHRPVGDSGETLFLAMMSKMAHVRLSAINALVAEAATTTPADEFVSRSLSNILANEADPVVYEPFVANLTVETLVKFIGADAAIGIITERVCAFRKKKWAQVNEHLIKLVCNGLAASASSRAVLRFLLTMSVALRPGDVKLIRQCLESSIAKSHAELKHLTKCTKISEDTMEPVEICDSVAAALAKGFSSTSVESSIELLLREKPENLRTCYGSLRFVEHLISQAKPLGVGVLNASLDALQAMLPSLCEADHELEALAGGTLPIRAVTRVITALLKNMQPIRQLDKVPSWHKQLDAHSSELTFLRRVFLIAVDRQKHEASFKDLLTILFTMCLPSPAARCNFLCDMLIGHLAGGVQSDESVQLQAHALCILAEFVSELPSNVPENESEECSDLIIVSIMVVLLSSSKRIRRLAIHVLDHCPSDPFIEYLVKHAAAAGDVDVIRKHIATFHKSHKVAFLNRMLNHDDLTSIVRLGVARLLSNVTSTTTLDLSMELLQRRYIENAGLTIDAVNCEIISLCLAKLAICSMKKLGQMQHDVLFGVLRSSNEALCLLGLRCLSSELFEKMTDSEVSEIVDLLLSSVIDAASETQRNSAEQALKTVCRCHWKLVIAELRKVSDDELAGVQSVRDVKRMRTSLKQTADVQNAGDDPLETQCWRRAVVLLEILHGVDELPATGAEQITTALYDVLKRSLELPSSSLNVEYVKQCVLSCLLVHGTGSDEVLQPHRHQIGLLVKALRLSQSAQTQHSILAMLNHMATLYPDEVLQNMTSVFTFMGTSLLRQEDEYSFQVVVQTIQSVIPILLEASKSKSNKDVVSKVTRVFVDSWPDIPEHRRQPIFKKLIETLGPSDYVWTLVAQMIDHLLEKEADLEECDFLDFMLGLVGDLSIDTILCSCHQLLKFASVVPLHQRLSNRVQIDKEIVNVGQCNDQRLADFRSVAAMFVEQVLSGTNFLSLAAELADSNDTAQTEQRYEALLAISLESIHGLNAAIQDRADDDLLESWKSCISLLHDCVDRVIGVLRPDALVLVIQQLLAEDLGSIRRNAMDMLNNKLIDESYFDAGASDLIASLVEPLCIQLQKSTPEGAQDVLNQQTALISLKLLCRRLPAGAEEFAKIFAIVEKLFRSHEKLSDVLVGAVLCLFAELCHSCPTRMLGHFAKLMKRFLSISSAAACNEAVSSEAIVLGLTVSYHRLVENLTGFLSPYLPAIIGDVCRLCVDNELAKRHDTVVGEQLSKICAHIGGNVPLRVLLPSIEDCLGDRPLVKEQPQYLNHLLRIFKAAIESSDRHMFDQQREVVQSLVLRLLHYREQASTEQMDAEHVTTAEVYIVDCVTALSLKMSEMTFRPFFAKLYTWATFSGIATTAAGDEASDQEALHRVATFYHLCYKLSDTLKGLFVLFAGQFIQHAVTTLSAYRTANATDSVRLETTSWILGTLSNCFQYGGKAFVTVEMYKTVAKPIVDEIENTAECPASPYDRRILTRLAPAVANLAVACLDADCKDLHNKVLFKTRNTSPRIRFSALQTFASMVRRLGDDYVPLLPESVPFLAELMEDDHAEVENLTQEVVQEMEQLLGEPLMKYF